MAPDELAWNVLTAAEQAYVKSVFYKLFSSWPHEHDFQPLRFMLKNNSVVVTLALPTSDTTRLIHTPLEDVRGWIQECIDLNMVTVQVKRFKLWQTTWIRRAGHLHFFNGQLKCTLKIVNKTTSMIKCTPEGRTIVVSNI